MCVLNYNINNACSYNNNEIKSINEIKCARWTFIPVHAWSDFCINNRAYGLICDYAMYSQQKHMICNLCMVLSPKVNKTAYWLALHIRPQWIQSGLLIVNIESLKHTLHYECINKQHALKWKHHIRMCLYVSERSDLSTAHNQHRCMIWSLDIAYKMHNLIYEQTDSKQAITETSYNALITITARNRTRQLISLCTHLWKLLTLFISWNH